MFTFPNSVPTTNKFAQLESLPIPDPPTPQTPRIPPLMVRQSDNIRNKLKTINESFPAIKITLSRELLKIYSKDSDENLKITQFFKNSKMDFFLPRTTLSTEIEQELSALKFTNPKVTQLTNNKTKTPIAVSQIVLPKTKENEKIFDLNKLLYLSVKIEKFNRRPGATQYYSCNRFHHNSANCFSTPRCLKCGEAHPTKDCPIREKLKTPVVSTAD
ncbi:nucleic-acid-binding protein from transposon X-element [Caerostris extrusa]|uniref:Nucleic-acid-binding protein from transposon X-element n=1 Tax=Caerostris extrusa TaxID=172846 RepID=A0AAV4PZJ6_CAEEX|nr:nucleic-acid-binding protein from transposon X-element [Caerostris extrusa]